jgi:FG-GAP-like repeat/ASPIC and UnbV
VPLVRRLTCAGLGGGLLWLLASLGTPPARAVEAPQEKVELVSAASASQARLVSRLMATGFALDQLVIPGSRHLGRLPLSELDPLLQAELRKSGPGRPVSAPRPQGDLLVAQILPSYPGAILGGSGSAQETSRMGSKVAFSPTNADLLYAEVDVDAEDLAAVCRAKETLIAQEVESARAAVQALPPGAPLPRLIGAQARLGGALSFTGDFKGAIKSFTSIRERLARETPSVMQQKQLAMAIHALGILELRRGETDNCVLHHNREMCLFPLSAAARHTAGDGARRALDHFLRYQQLEPEDLEARWLLNVAAMTIGAYPEGVPEALRIGPEAFASGEELGRFPDVAGPAGLGLVQSAGGTVTDDFDGDGLLDVVLSSRDPCEPLRFLKSRGDGTFVEETERAGLAAQLGGLNVTQTDYDNDGRLDLFVMRGGWETAIRNSLLRNEGGGRFTDVTAAAGLGGVAHRTHSAAWGDFDNDGWLDVFVGHELTFSQLFRNRGNGTFEDVTERAGVMFRALTKAVVWGDIDNDGWPDLYVSNFGQRNLLFHNLGNGRFEEVGGERGVSEPYFSFTTWFWDYDNDGWQDLLVVTDVPTLDEQPREYLSLPHRGETLRVYRNRGQGFFEDATKALGLARVIPTMGANFGDLDHDGYLDFYLGTGAPSYSLLIPNRMFRNQQGRAFVDVTASTGTGHLQKGHGVAFADLDNDGDQDVFAHLGGAFPGDKYASALFENPGHGNDWLALRLRGTRTNRAALGARIRVVLDENGREAQRVRHVTSGGSFGSSPLLQTIGLGRGARVKRIEVDWPTSRTRQVVEDAPVNSAFEMVEGEAGLRPLERKRFTLGGASSAQKSKP